MNLLFCLESILSDFRFMFNSQNFALFQVSFIYGFITHTGQGTLTQLYQSSASQTRYGSFPKFLSRGSGLMIFDAAYARRRVFDMLLSLGHHILCRAKSNAVFYRIPNPPKHPKPGRPKKYGDRLNIRRGRYKTVSVLQKTYSVTAAVVRTKMCPVDVRLVVIRRHPKP